MGHGRALQDPPQSFLAELTDREQGDLRSRAVSRRFRRHATLVHQGEAPGRVLVIEAGRAKVSSITDDGREIVLAFVGPGDLLGELSALSGAPRAATVRALEPLSALAFAAYQTVTRVARRLVELAQRYGEQTGTAIRITLPISQEELAGWAGASREAITKALHDLRAIGLIETHRRHITVLDAEQLGQMAGVAPHS